MTSLIRLIENFKKYPNKQNAKELARNINELSNYEQFLRLNSSFHYLILDYCGVLNYQFLINLITNISRHQSVDIAEFLKHAKSNNDRLVADYFRKDKNDPVGRQAQYSTSIAYNRPRELDSVSEKQKIDKDFHSSTAGYDFDEYDRITGAKDALGNRKDDSREKEIIDTIERKLEDMDAFLSKVYGFMKDNEGIRDDLIAIDRKLTEMEASSRRDESETSSHPSGTHGKDVKFLVCDDLDDIYTKIDGIHETLRDFRSEKNGFRQIYISKKDFDAFQARIEGEVVAIKKSLDPSGSTNSADPTEKSTTSEGESLDKIHVIEALIEEGKAELLNMDKRIEKNSADIEKVKDDLRAAIAIIDESCKTGSQNSGNTALAPEIGELIERISIIESLVKDSNSIASSETPQAPMRMNLIKSIANPDSDEDIEFDDGLTEKVVGLEKRIEQLEADFRDFAPSEKSENPELVQQLEQMNERIKQLEYQNIADSYATLYGPNPDYDTHLKGLECRIQAIENRSTLDVSVGSTGSSVEKFDEVISKLKSLQEQSVQMKDDFEVLRKKVKNANSKMKKLNTESQTRFRSLSYLSNMQLDKCFGKSPKDIFDLCIEGNNESVMAMIDQTPTLVDMKNINGYTPLIYAALKGNYDLCEFLISRGANVNAQNNFGQSALHYASNNDTPDIVRLLVENNADMNITDTLNKTPLRWATQRNKSSVIKYLRSKGARE